MTSLLFIGPSYCFPVPRTSQIRTPAPYPAPSLRQPKHREYTVYIWTGTQSTHRSKHRELEDNTPCWKVSLPTEGARSERSDTERNRSGRHTTGHIQSQAHSIPRRTIDFTEPAARFCYQWCLWIAASQHRDIPLYQVVWRSNKNRYHRGDSRLHPNPRSVTLGKAPVSLERLRGVRKERRK